MTRRRRRRARRVAWIAATLATLAGGDASLAARAGRDGCRTRACVDRVLMRHYRAHPMPACTWRPESDWDPATGESFHGRPWARGRYRIVNAGSGAGGKYQFLPSTWRAVGGGGRPQDARPAEQERRARVLMRRAGLAQWVNC